MDTNRPENSLLSPEEIKAVITALLDFFRKSSAAFRERYGANTEIDWDNLDQEPGMNELAATLQKFLAEIADPKVRFQVAKYLLDMAEERPPD
jgi:hypothetical protein